MDWRLGIDLGTNSLGWWAFSLTGSSEKGWKIEQSLDGGVYIFSDGREPAKAGRVGESNAVARRLARGMRRNRDRRKARLRGLMKELLALGLLPEDPRERKVLFQTLKGSGDPERYNPYRLRSDALERPLEPHELGRVLFHLGLRRGFKSNRIDASEEDGGKLKERIAELHAILSGRTLGQYLWQRYREESGNQGKDRNAAGLRFRGETPFYPDREMYRQEFEAIRQQQATHHGLSTETWDRLRDRYILFQWPLKPVERGACTFFPDESRHWKETPIGHDFRIYQELNALRWIDADLVEHSLNPEQRRAVLGLLMTRKSDVTFDSFRKLKAADRAPLFAGCRRFNLESEKRKALKPHAIAARFSDHPLLRSLWEARSSEEGDGGKLEDIFQAPFRGE